MTNFYVIQETDVGRPHIRAFGRTWPVVNFMGRIMMQDVGKRVYLVWNNAHDSQLLEVESTEQFRKRKDA